MDTLDHPMTVAHGPSGIANPPGHDDGSGASLATQHPPGRAAASIWGAITRFNCWQNSQDWGEFTGTGNTTFKTAGDQRVRISPYSEAREIRSNI